jgi:alpha-L-arabinofuranosidase
VTAVTAVDVLSGTDPKAANSWENPNAVTPKPGSAIVTERGTASLQAPPLSFTALRARVEKR